MRGMKLKANNNDELKNKTPLFNIMNLLFQGQEQAQR